MQLLAFIFALCLALTVPFQPVTARPDTLRIGATLSLSGEFPAMSAVQWLNGRREIVWPGELGTARPVFREN